MEDHTRRTDILKIISPFISENKLAIFIYQNDLNTYYSLNTLKNNNIY